MERLNTIEDAHNYASSLLKSDELDIAEKLSSLTKQFKNDYFLNFLLASELAENNDPIQAIEKFEYVLELEPNFHLARFQLCMTSLLFPNQEVIDKHLPIMLKLNEENCFLQFAKSLKFILSEDIEKAIDYIKQGIQLNEGYPALNDNMQQIITLLQSDKKQELNTVNPSIKNTILLDVYKKKS